MDSEALVAMLAAALALMGSPGPATLSIAATSAVFGIGRALHRGSDAAGRNAE